VKQNYQNNFVYFKSVVNICRNFLFLKQEIGKALLYMLIEIIFIVKCMRTVHVLDLIMYYAFNKSRVGLHLGQLEFQSSAR